MYGEGNLETPWKDSIPICHVYREYSGRNAALAEGKPRIPVYRFLISLPDFPGAQGSRNGFCRFVKKYDNKTKNTDTILCSMSPPYCGARICIRVFVLPFYRKNQPPRELIFLFIFL
jgi:hypothetical protein